MELLKGYRVYLSIVLSLLGSFGFFEKVGVTQEDAGKFVDAVMVVVFSASALWYNYQNHKKMK